MSRLRGFRHFVRTSRDETDAGNRSGFYENGNRTDSEKQARRAEKLLDAGFSFRIKVWQEAA
jgi:hypothetical protein